MTRTSHGRITILVVTSAESTRALAFSSFSRARFDVHFAGDIDAALERYDALGPDVVVLDAGLESTEQLCRGLRSASPFLPVILAVTGDDAAGIDRVFEAGATDIVAFDSSWATLGRRVVHLVRAARGQADQRAYAAGVDRALRRARVGWWEWSIGDGKFHGSEALRGLLGYADGPRSFPGFLRWVHVQDRNRLLALAGAAADGAGAETLVYRLVAADGTIHRVRQHAEIERDGAGKPVRVLGTLHEVDDADRMLDAHPLAEFDPVTRLPNRRRLMDRMRLAFDLAERNSGTVGILFLDLDGFKRINDSLGHDAGDRVLCEAGDRLSRVIRKTDLAARNVDHAPGELVARFGGDEFVIVLPELRRPEDAFIVARRVIAELARPYETDGQEVFTTVSVGIATFPADGTDPEVLLKHADTAMYEVKESGKNGFRAFTESMNQRARERLEIESGLRRAIQRDELFLLYQPKYSVRTERIVGVEALLRWKKPDGRVVSPDQFIWVAEEGNLILPLGRWVFEEVCRQLEQWDREGLPDIRVAINVSSRQFNQPRYAEYIARTLARKGILPSRLELELTEGSLMKNPEQIGDSLAELKSMGLKLALDDFGTGYASLSLLRRFPLDSVKIDRSFIQGVPDDGDSVAVTSAVLMMAQALGLAVVAEGVETEAQRELLASLGCDEIQGFLLSPPVSAERLAEMVAGEDEDREDPARRYARA